MPNHFQKCFLIFLFLCASPVYGMKRSNEDNNISTATEWWNTELIYCLKQVDQNNNLLQKKYWEQKIRGCIENGADPNCKLENGKTILMLAIKSGDQGLINYLLELLSIDIDAYSKRGNNPLYYVLKKQYTNRNAVNKELFEKLLSLGANPDGVGESEAPLAHAALFRNVDYTELLIKYGADVNKEDYWGFPPLKWAIEEGNPEIIKMLCDAGAFFEKDKNGYTPFHLAVSAKLPEKSIKIIIMHLHKTETEIDNVYNRVKNIKKILEIKNSLEETALDWLCRWYSEDKYAREVGALLNPVKLQNDYDRFKKEIPGILTSEPNNLICQIHKCIIKKLKH